MIIQRKILIISTWYPSIENPILGTFFREQAALFTDIFDIKVLCGKKKTDITRLKKLYNTLIFLLFGRITLREKKDYFLSPPNIVGFEYECGINFLDKMNYHISVSAYLTSAKKLLQKWDFTIIHTHDTLMAGISAFYINRILNIPYIITEHNYLQLRFPDFIKKDFCQAIESSYKTLLVSEYQLRNLLMYGIKCKWDVIGNFVDDSIFKSGGNEKSDGIFNILFIGRNAYHKDLNTLWNVILEFDKKCCSNDYCFTIIGNSFEQTVAAQELISRFESEGKMEIIPFANREGIIKYFDRADVYLSTSIAETFGVGICEAMMCGIPVVSTNNGGIDEMFIPGVNGIKSKIGDFRTLADSLYKIKSKRVVFDPVKIRASVIGKFGRKAFKSKMLDIYNKVYE